MNLNEANRSNEKESIDEVHVQYETNWGIYHSVILFCSFILTVVKVFFYNYYLSNPARRTK